MHRGAQQEYLEVLWVLLPVVLRGIGVREGVRVCKSLASDGESLHALKVELQSWRFVGTQHNYHAMAVLDNHFCSGMAVSPFAASLVTVIFL